MAGDIAEMRPSQTTPDTRCPDEGELAESLRLAIESVELVPMLRFVELAAQVPEEQSQLLLARYPEWHSYRHALAPRYARYISDREVAHTHLLLEEGSQKVTSAFADRTYARVKDIFEHISFTDCTRFVMVGCGPFPATILHVVDRARVPSCIGLDMDMRAVALSRQLVSHLGQPGVTVEHADGRTYDFSEASVVYIANLTADKRDVIARVSCTARPGTPVILRDPYALGVLIAESGAEGDLFGLKVTARGDPEVRFLSRHVFLETQGPPVGDR